ncbi:Tim44/TimA family putative adaptor protein [Pleomorphomonas sp. JP5]|uniref:Tim44/TimA family putative adaptor protein n=1 Tax=Pleomorphomonas sp. JP5 TaxID=2942998 RepID=UPI00204449A8|nr:Tim44/TimA family putative adaptor protein [Pleomorphomonas sp. JP5]MCM5559721.1 Tim44/TimA family putative adaptor protein [Pleomorphomonas sp. JP5]
MNAFLDLTSLIFLVIAAVIFWRLRSVLGTRTGNEKPPFDPFAGRKAEVEPPPAGDNVVTLPREGRPDPREAVLARIDEAFPEGGVNTGLKAIATADRNFDLDSFMGGASAAYEMIVSAFAAGDRQTLKPLLSREVFDGFSSVITEREGRGEKIDFTFVGIDKSDVVDAGVEEGIAQVTVRFSSQLISVTRDRDGSVVEGDPQKVAEVTDVWTFAREIRSSDPNWKLVATDAGA